MSYLPGQRLSKCVCQGKIILIMELVVVPLKLIYEGLFQYDKFWGYKHYKWLHLMNGGDQRLCRNYR